MKMKTQPEEIDPLEEIQKDRSKRRSRRNDHKKYDSREVPPWEKPKRKGHRGDYDDNEMDEEY